jgi:hypothetical protein
MFGEGGNGKQGYHYIHSIQNFYFPAVYICALLPFTFDQKMSLSLDSGVHRNLALHLSLHADLPDISRKSPGEF